MFNCCIVQGVVSADMTQLPEYSVSLLIINSAFCSRKTTVEKPPIHAMHGLIWYIKRPDEKIVLTELFIMHFLHGYKYVNFLHNVLSWSLDFSGSRVKMHSNFIAISLYIFFFEHFISLDCMLCVFCSLFSLSSLWILSKIWIMLAVTWQMQMRPQLSSVI